MKIKRLKIENFKQFRGHEIRFVNDLTNDISDRFLLLGDNGTGKTTVLQAIALVLSFASRTIKNVAEFKWPGWISERYRIWGTPKIELDLVFQDEEILATQEVAQQWHHAGFAKGDTFHLPGSHKNLKIVLENEWIQAFDEDNQVAPNGLLQLKGRFYASSLLKTNPHIRTRFADLPGFFWFDQYRNVLSSTQDSSGITQLREYLTSWYVARLQGSQTNDTDWLGLIERNFQLIFPDRSFGGLESRYQNSTAAPNGHFFLFKYQDRTYDIEEMSAGEQAVFPVLLAFVKDQIANSIVLFDEIDLNLHPPLAQGLLAALPKIGEKCQFILTTHSEDVRNGVSPHEIHRLEGGHPCL